MPGVRPYACVWPRSDPWLMNSVTWETHSSSFSRMPPTIGVVVDQTIVDTRLESLTSVALLIA